MQHAQHSHQYLNDLLDFLDIDHNLRTLIVLSVSLIFMHFVNFSNIVNQVIFINMGMSAEEWTPYLDNLKDVVAIITALVTCGVLVYNTFFKHKVKLETKDGSTGKEKE